MTQIQVLAWILAAFVFANESERTTLGDRIEESLACAHLCSHIDDIIGDDLHARDP